MVIKFRGFYYTASKCKSKISNKMYLLSNFLSIFKRHSARPSKQKSPEIIISLWIRATLFISLFFPLSNIRAPKMKPYWIGFRNTKSFSMHFLAHFASPVLLIPSFLSPPLSLRFSRDMNSGIPKLIFSILFRAGRYSHSALTMPADNLNSPADTIRKAPPTSRSKRFLITPPAYR